jgi:formamidopyrimidine-DNA glycosylase
MPELAEVEFYRRKWNAGVGASVTGVAVHGEKRLFRRADVAALEHRLPGTKYLSSEAHGKQMAFRFSKNIWLGIHLGMTGELRVEPPDFKPARHDHLVLFQRERSLIFRDPRLFGRVLYYCGKGVPPWWSGLPPQILSKEFTLARLKERLRRHRSLPLKAALLDQATFPGIGNWMADEILWQARIHPRTRAGELSDAQMRQLWRTTRTVTKRAIASVAKSSDSHDFGDPPKGWLFHQRWRRGGMCPRDGTPLRHETIGGRTTAWCPQCQEQN